MRLNFLDWCKKGEREHILRQIAANQAAGFDVAELDQKEQTIRREMETTKNEYNETVKRLKQLKPNIDHLQHVRERARIEMHRQFDAWFESQATARPKSSASSSSKAWLGNHILFFRCFTSFYKRKYLSKNLEFSVMRKCLEKNEVIVEPYKKEHHPNRRRPGRRRHSPVYRRSTTRLRAAKESIIIFLYIP